jgi:FAD synthase
MNRLTDPASKIMTLADAVEWREKMRIAGKRVSLTNGCFDLLHRGHAEYLKAAAEHHEAAQERFMLGNLSGIEMRQAEQNLLDARERLVDTQFSTKACEISLLNISGQVVKLTE